MAESIGPRITGIEHDVDEIKRAVESIANHRNGSQNVTQVTFQGLGNISAVLAVGLVAGVCLGVSVAVAAWVAAAFSRQDNMNNWTAQEVTAIRSYITNGKLQPMKPRPMDSQSEQEKRQ